MRIYRIRSPSRWHCVYRPAVLVVCSLIAATVVLLGQRGSVSSTSGDTISPGTRRLQDAERDSVIASGVNDHRRAGSAGSMDGRTIPSLPTFRNARRLSPRSPPRGAGRLRPVQLPSVADAGPLMRPRQLPNMDDGATVGRSLGWPFPVRVFWHIAQAETLMWGLVVKEQLARIQRSGLLEKGATVQAWYVGDINSTPALEDRRVSVEYAGPASGYEWATLRRLEAYCAEQPTARVLYMHTKGSTHPVTEEVGWYTYNWRQLLEHMLLDNHEAVLRELKDGGEVDAAGPLLVSNEYAPLHFSGNFWAAKAQQGCRQFEAWALSWGALLLQCSYINTLKRIDEADVSDRLGAEFYISSPELKAKNCWGVDESDQCNPSKYDCNYEERLYRDFKGCGRPAPEAQAMA